MAKQPINQQKDVCVYVLGSRHKDDRRTYVGWTTDLEKRLRQHNSGSGAKSTRGREWRLLYSENCTTRNEAMSLEWHIKRDRKFRALLRAAIDLDEGASGGRQPDRDGPRDLLLDRHEFDRNGATSVKAAT